MQIAAVRVTVAVTCGGGSAKDNRNCMYVVERVLFTLSPDRSLQPNMSLNWLHHVEQFTPIYYLFPASLCLE